MINHTSHNEEAALADYFVFASIIVGIFLLTLIIYFFTALGSNLSNFLRIFMAVFLLVFAGFKFLDLAGFAESYVNYDLIAKKFPSYAYVYPFLELALSLGYFLNFRGTNFFTLILMTIGACGIGRELTKGTKIKCACLGTFVKVPLSSVSLIENILMGLMALSAIIFS